MRLEKLIEEASLIAGSQKDLAERLGLSKQNITDMKNGRRKCNLKTRARLAWIAGYEALPFLLDGVAEDIEESGQTEELEEMKIQFQELAASIRAVANFTPRKRHSNT